MSYDEDLKTTSEAWEGELEVNDDSPKGKGERILEKARAYTKWIKGKLNKAPKGRLVKITYKVGGKPHTAAQFIYSTAFDDLASEMGLALRQPKDFEVVSIEFPDRQFFTKGSSK